jgi:ribonuclease PH
MRPVSIQRGFVQSAHGSVLISCGRTRVVCTALVTDGVPPFLRNSNQGWLTAEYDMLPASTSERHSRSSRTGKTDARALEIQRLIGRSLRAVTDLTLLGQNTVWVDCDVIEADGGTRVLSVTGGYVALVDALRRFEERKRLARWPLRDRVAAVSVGLVDGRVCVDLDYAEDSTAEVDMNLVMTGKGRLVEVQGTAERAPFTAAELTRMLAAGRRAILQLTEAQVAALGSQDAPLAGQTPS